MQSSASTLGLFLIKLNIHLPYDPAIPLLSIYPEKTIIQNDTCTPIFIATPFTITRSWQQPKCPSTDEWIKNDVVRIFHCIYVPHLLYPFICRWALRLLP